MCSNVIQLQCTVSRQVLVALNKLVRHCYDYSIVPDTCMITVYTGMGQLDLCKLLLLALLCISEPSVNFASAQFDDKGQ